MYDRSNHESEKLNFVFVEITMFAGRTKETKQLLVRKIVDTIEEIEGVSTQEINCAIHEIESENYISGIKLTT